MMWPTIACSCNAARSCIGLVAMAIEELYAERLPESYEMLAYHYERGEVLEKALEYLVKAGQKAQQAYANQEALAHYERALAVCD
jgi:adenylate cyclase